MSASHPMCEHLESALLQQPKAHPYVCDACVEIGDRWVHLRQCLTCGVVRCCDSSPNRHATAHARSSGHPVVVSAEPGERWAWCYQDSMLKKY